VNLRNPESAGIIFMKFAVQTHPPPIENSAAPKQSVRLPTAQRAPPHPALSYFTSTITSAFIRPIRAIRGQIFQ